MAYLGNAAARAALDALTALANRGYLRIYTGSPPADPDGPPTGTQLAELTMGSPAFAPATDAGGAATASANPIGSDSAADATGTAGWFRVVAADGTTTVFQGTVSGPSGGGILVLDSTNITAGGLVTVTSFTVTLPE